MIVEALFHKSRKQAATLHIETLKLTELRIICAIVGVWGKLTCQLIC